MICFFLPNNGRETPSVGGHYCKDNNNKPQRDIKIEVTKSDGSSRLGLIGHCGLWLQQLVIPPLLGAKGSAGSYNMLIMEIDSISCIPHCGYSLIVSQLAFLMMHDFNRNKKDDGSSTILTLEVQ
ncbi:hypothetical protein VNO77_39254 [Canavalia gladiata]|uniref:Uncharacterized protein n=1 Tax=Canavalia gladiata TaxID=3824 RepID=A0AAN9PWY9_CANGL